MFIRYMLRPRDILDGAMGCRCIWVAGPRIGADRPALPRHSLWHPGGDFVTLHVHVKFQPEELGLAIVEIFRLEHGKIVEHWDVRQPIPETAANTNGMF
jgi:hypothetical protein